MALHGVQPGFRQGLMQFIDISADPRADVAVQPSRHAALVFTDFRQDFGRPGNKQAFWQGLLDLPFVAVVQEREQEVDGHCLGFQGFDLAAQLIQIRLGQRLQLLSVECQAPAGFETEIRRNGRLFERGRQVIEFGAGLASQAQNIGESAVGDVGAAGTLALQHGVGGNGRSVNQVKNLLQVDAQIPKSVQDRPRRGIRIGWHLVDSPRFAIQHGEIRECTAGVNADAHHLFAPDPMLKYEFF